MRKRRSLFLLPLYFTKEALPFIGITFLILTTLILAQQIGRQPELISLPSSLSLKAIIYLLPSVVIITLPFSLLIGIIVGLNRLSADSEIIAARSSGLSLSRLAIPILALGSTAVLLSFALTHYAAPWSFRQLRLTKEVLIRETLGHNIRPHTFSTYFPNYLIYVQDIEQNSGNWRGVFILKKDSPKNTRLFTAASGEIRITETTPPSIEIQLLQGLSLETSDDITNQNLASFSKLIIKLTNLSGTSTNNSLPDSQLSVQEMTTQQLADRMADHTNPKDILQATIEYHKRSALPFASLVLVIIAIIAGARTSRHSGRAAGLALGFSVAITYYLILIAGQNLALSKTLPSLAGVWLANITCLITAIILARSNYSPNLRSVSRYRILLAPSKLHPQLTPRSAKITRPHRRHTHITTLINYLVISELAKYFSLSLGILVIISIIFTLFDLLPAMSHNNISPQYTLTYLTYLTPQIAYYVAPFALLVSILTTYNVLARTNQLTALLASGQGAFILSLPSLFAVALLVTILLTLSESVLPHTNREQDYRYHLIKGRQIEQAAVAFGQKWVYGLNHTIYSYQYLDRDNLLLNTTAYSLDPTQYLLREMTYAQRAIPLSPQTWSVSAGYSYTILNHQMLVVSAAPPQQLILTIPEGAALLRRTTNEATKMNLGELRNYLEHLTLIGVPTTDLRIDLEKKKAFPFTCLTLAALALSFTLNAPRRGALAGLGLSIGLSIGFSLAFWSATAILEAAGKRSLLPVWMAVWGAQALFLTLAIYLSLRHKL